MFVAQQRDHIADGADDKKRPPDIEKGRGNPDQLAKEQAEIVKDAGRSFGMARKVSKPVFIEGLCFTHGVPPDTLPLVP
jgi:hypothetical protein